MPMITAHRGKCLLQPYGTYLQCGVRKLCGPSRGREPHPRPSRGDMASGEILLALAKPPLARAGKSSAHMWGMGCEPRTKQNGDHSVGTIQRGPISARASV